METRMTSARGVIPFKIRKRLIQFKSLAVVRMPPLNRQEQPNNTETNTGRGKREEEMVHRIFHLPLLTILISDCPEATNVLFE
jgi:hypothetical protein